MPYLLRRLITSLITLWLVSLVVFVLLRVLPGDPATIMLGTEGSPEALADLRARLHLDDPLSLQYLNWLASVARGDLGDSFRFERPVRALILERLPVTLSLASLAMLLAVAIAIPLGTLAATRHNTRVDHAILVFAQFGLAVPFFWLGILFILFFALALRWFPSGGYVAWTENPRLALQHLLLPAISLALVLAAVLTRQTRAAMLEVLHQDYVRTAHAKGLRARSVLTRHTLRNALMPVVTLIGLQIGNLLGGSIVVEQVFALPGLGRLVLFAVTNRDWMLIQGLVFFIAALVVALNLLVDALYVRLDPRVSLR